MMPRYGAELSMDSNYKDNDRMNKRKPKEEHIHELNEIPTEGKDEGKGSLWEMGFEMMSRPLGWWNDSKISVGSR